MILLTVQDLVRQFDTEPVLNKVSFDISSGDKIGLVGPNGAGKSTLLRIMMRIDDADSGSIEHPASLEIAMLEQEADFDDNRTLLEEAKSGLAHLYELQSESIRAAEDMATVTDPVQLDRLHARFDHLQHELERLNAYNVDHRVDEVLQGLGFTEAEYDRPLNTFSGGQQNRVLLARLLLRAPDLMILDEPTNHLDIDATEWLESYLSSMNGTLLLVSHDRYFLDRVTNRTFELYKSKLTDYKGNFSAYWRQREERIRLQQKSFEKQQEFIEKTSDFIRRNQYGQKHAQASDRVKKLDRLDKIDNPTDFDTPFMDFAKAERTGDWVFDIKGLSKGYGEPLFKDLTLQIERGERLGVLGPNGCGKSTFLKTLVDELKPDTGKIRHGTNVKIGYYDQQLSGVDPSLDGVEAARPLDNPEITPGFIRNWLAKFGVKGDLAVQKVGAMSGGEKSKVALTRLALQFPNVLILDEPTNHLDLWARQSLEEALLRFDGTILFVSHDRYFIDQVARSVLVFEPDSCKYFEGNYSKFQKFHERRRQEQNKPATNNTAKSAPVEIAPPPVETPVVTQKTPSTPAIPKSKRKRKFSYRKVEDIEVEIAEREELKSELEAKLIDPQIQRDGEQARIVREEYDSTCDRLEELFEHWEEAVELN
ncbi:putative ABC transporter ATP-binding protein YheS [Polystyrenella longa]|uniref:Putative ABC transporter ATP-binding protein YheS n=1 Tax=Polystyrenella longa TaxID=2528007 RepID=A0A518CRW9_9PLAN|nr:ABC-F family ATP-binding cassette domain-containing protein [Polystyrenella longa]QDU81976.1 putative ABC transporter ATP-binding protein YheS [Polystyrenella longa]